VIKVVKRTDQETPKHMISNHLKTISLVLQRWVCL